MLHLRPTNPRRPPDWRWKRAKELAERGGRISRRWDDEHMPRIHRFARQVQRAQSDRALERICMRDPELFEAYMLYNDASPENLTRAELEARLLTPQHYSEVATRLNMADGTIDAYEKYFFNVKPHLRSPGYVAHVVIGRELQYGLSERRVDLLMKIYAMAYGPYVLDWLVMRCQYGNYLGPDASVMDVLEDERDSMLRLKGAIAARTMPVTWETQEAIINLAFRLKELQAGADSAEAQSTLLAGLGEALQSLPWFAGIGAPPESQPKLLSAADESPISLRANELYNIDSMEADIQELLTNPPDVSVPGTDDEEKNNSGN